MTDNPYESPNSIKGVGRANWPPLVRIALWGLGTRASAWAFFAISVALGVGSIIYGLFDVRFFIGGLFFFSALWYYLAIRWVDQHGNWNAN